MPISAVADALVAVAVGHGRGQGDEVVGGQADRFVGVGRIGMDYRPLWSSVTVPRASTLTLNTSRLLTAVRPSTTLPFRTRLTASPLAVSTRPVEPALMPSV